MVVSLPVRWTVLLVPVVAALLDPVVDRRPAARADPAGLSHRFPS